tara:strand:+ start:1112 stop:1414 length:303 start_codon:yes stop_codon:yes gene_type:complete
MEHEKVVESFAELGNPHRLSVFRLLVKAGPEGATVGVIQDALKIPGSTLSHHLTRMTRVELITQERVSRTIVCKLNFPHLGGLIQFLQDECCQGIEDGPA